MNSHIIRKKIYQNIKEQVINITYESEITKKEHEKNNVYSRHNLYKYRKGNIYQNGCK